MSEMTSLNLQAEKALIGASIPRSGHHFLQRVLSLYFGDQLHYCEWYGPPDCCRQVPCTRTGYRATYQKSHDWDFSLAQHVDQALYLIQYRHPVPEALSDRDLMRDSINSPSYNYRLSREYYGWWLAGKAIYYRNFHQKWFAKHQTNGVYLQYDALTRKTAETVSPIIEWVDGSVDAEKLAGSIAEARQSRGSSREAYKPRVIEESAYFDRDLLAPFETYVLDRCPKFEFQPLLSGSYKDHWLYGLILLQDPEEPLPDGEEDHLDAAAKLAPNHPEVRLRLAKRELERGALEPAVGILEKTVQESPFFGQAYRLLVDTCKAAGRHLPDALSQSSALFACAEHPAALTEIAKSMLESERVVNAVAALSFVTVLQPENFRAHHLLARGLIRLGRWQEARRFAERAAEIKPDQEPNKKLLANIRNHLGTQ